mmetsp:Transcript_21579/g.33231  ORF Transcript_21579/g.33231 Transcript_21579/m.33231 type:complete len:278 (+) Transcript_21579:567-1400(+)
MVVLTLVVDVLASLRVHNVVLSFRTVVGGRVALGVELPGLIALVDHAHIVHQVGGDLSFTINELDLVGLAQDHVGVECLSEHDRVLLVFVLALEAGELLDLLSGHAVIELRVVQRSHGDRLGGHGRVGLSSRELVLEAQAEVGHSVGLRGVDCLEQVLSQLAEVLVGDSPLGVGVGAEHALLDLLGLEVAGFGPGRVVAMSPHVVVVLSKEGVLGLVQDVGDRGVDGLALQFSVEPLLVELLGLISADVGNDLAMSISEHSLGELEADANVSAEDRV